MDQNPLPRGSLQIRVRTGEEPRIVSLDDHGPRLLDRISLKPLTGATREDGSVITSGIPTIPEEALS